MDSRLASLKGVVGRWLFWIFVGFWCESGSYGDFRRLLLEHGVCSEKWLNTALPSCLPLLVFLSGFPSKYLPRSSQVSFRELMKMGL